MEYFHLTAPQQNIWNLQKYYEGTAISNLCGAVFYNENRDPALLQQAVLHFIKNQRALRLRFCEKDEPKQYVTEQNKELIPAMTFSSMKEFDTFAEKFAKEPLGLLDCSMYRFVVFQVENKSGILVLLSHLISDAWTFGLMANQLDEAYHKLKDDVDIPLVEADYLDYVQSEDAYLQSERYAKDRVYWEEKYANRPEESPIKLCTVPSDSIAAKRVTRTLPLPLEQKIEEYCKAYTVTQAVLFETALITYLSKINSENQTVTIGVPILNRSNAREKNIAGMFIATMPLTVTITNDMTALELSKQITKGHMDLFRHQKYPYSSILKNLREKQNFSGNLYDVMISYQNAKTHSVADTKWYCNGYSEVPFVIHIDNRDEKDCHTINVDYQTEIFRDEAEVTYIIDRLEFILEQIVEDNTRPIRNISIVPKREYDRIVYEFNDTYVDYPREKSIHELFMEQAAKTPERTALVYEDKKFTYRQLDEMSNSLACFLRDKGVGHGDMVAVLLKRDERVIIAQLAVLKLGAVFIPIDSRYPKDRVEYIINESHARILLKNQDNSMCFPVECCVEEWDTQSVGEYEFVQTSSDDACYAIFTSGSTGKPKGCLLTQKGLVNFCINLNILKYCDQLENKICISVNTISFDMFILESLLPLVNGYTIVLANEEQSVNREAFKTLLCNSHANIIQTTPTKYKIFFDPTQENAYAEQLDIIASSGEALPLELLRSFLENTNAKIFNPMGPSECTIYVVGGEMSSLKKAVQQTDITLGKPIANTQIYILDKNNTPLPIGVAGELCTAGEGVGKGYLNRPELTVERFVPNPFATEENHHGKIMYHTGDLARWRADGEIEYLGRIDTQVKIRGLRIELGEIESVMSGFEGIGLTAASDKRDENNRQYLVGYYTSSTEVDEKKLREHLSAKLPKYMVPNYFMRLEEMPMTSSGKIDRKNLPEPDFMIQGMEYVEPTTDTEKKLAGIWQELLHIEKVGKMDDFFELGGDSLFAISMLNEIENVFDAEISIKDIMEKSSLEQLAQCIDQAHTVSRIPANHEKKYVLLPQQKAIYTVYSKNPDTLTYNMPAKIRLPENIDRDRLKQSICQVLNHHKLLKNHIEAEENEIYGVYDEDAEIVFEECKNGQEAAFIRPFDLGKAPLARIGFTEDALLFDMHHIVADGDSLNIILRDIVLAYDGNALPESRIAYSDYAKYFYKLDTEEHKAYFKEILNCDFEPIMLPETRNARQGGRSKVYQIPEEIFIAAKKLARKNGLTETMVFLGAYGILLSKYTAKKDILSSIILQNRVHTDTRDMVGMFVNTLPIHLAVKENIKEYMQGIKDLVLNLFRYQELPFWDIANAVGMSDKSVINTSFVYQGDGEKILNLSGQRLVPEMIDTHTAKFDLTMELTPVESGCRIRMEYDCAKYREQLIDDLVEAYIRILSQLEKEKVADISVLSEKECHRVVEEFNDTYVDYPRDKCVHELFSEQVRQTPEKIALVFEDKKFTYRQLDEMSNSLAHFLREKGVRPNEVVPIIAKRSWHVIVAMLGVLKAGGAYMLIDYQYPQDRIEYLIKECKADLILVYGYQSRNSIDLEEVNFSKNRDVLSNINDADDIFCVIHTSGSTGVPKVTALTHANIVHCVKNSMELLRGTQQAISTTTIVFDAFIQETIVALCNNIPVILLNENQITKQDAFEEQIMRYTDSFLFQTPTKLMSYIKNSSTKKFIKHIKSFVLGGEIFPEELYEYLSETKESNIFNEYGPTETSVYVAVDRLRSGKDITIGKPITNTQIYILDKDSKPLPIDVAGELYIAGEGVGKGYLNRPELTAERFIPNPFATKENRHGKIMYRTGDLACWREDGEIEYLGRIDTQVKIRGLRIELGEIESVMSSFEGIGLTAVADKRDENNRQYLVGYYTSDTEVEEKKLREHLSTKLPKYMVPNYFIHLASMPMTPSGKIDRKNLPMPDFTAQTTEYIAPVTEMEKKLCWLLETMLHTEHFGVTDDFFEFGGDSLTAIEYVAKAHSIGIDFALQNVFDYPTVQSLCALMEKGEKEKIRYEASDFDKYESLFAENVVDEAFIPEKKSLGNVMLTGATGFLGAHVLDVLMKEETGKIYCLVRSGERDDRRGRIHEILQYYFGNRYEAEFGRRILPIIGDIERDDLAENMPADVQTVIHTAASVKHYGSYDYFHRVNVEGTRHIVKYAKEVGAKLIHISTLSVSGNTMADDFTVYRSEEEKHFYETSLYIDQPLNNVYMRSKFEAEMAVYDAMLEGLEAKVIRVGNLTSRLSDYKFQPNYTQNAFLTRVKAALEFGLFPDYLLPQYAEFSPVDLTAEGVVKIAQYADRQCVFHLNSNRPIYFDRFLEVIHELGISMRVVSSDVFNKELQQTIQNSGTEYIYEAFQNDMDERGRLVYDSNIRIMNDFTVWFLKKTGFEWNETDLEYIKGYLEYFRGIGYLKV